MNECAEYTEIRQQTQLALPSDDSYLFRLGIALYGFASINSFMTEIICHIDPSRNRTTLLDLTSGDVLSIFRQTRTKIKSGHKYSSIHKTMKEAADSFEKLNSERTDFVHAYPITSSKNKEQILHRRKDDKNKYFEVDNDFLDDFISRLHIVSGKLDEIRKVVRSDI